MLLYSHREGYQGMWIKWISQILIMATCLCGTGILYTSTMKTSSKKIKFQIDTPGFYYDENKAKKYTSTKYAGTLNGVDLILPIYIDDGKPVVQFIPPPTEGKIIPLKNTSKPNVVFINQSD